MRNAETKTATRAILYAAAFALALFVGACDSAEPDPDDDGRVAEAPGTFNASAEGSQVLGLSGQAVYGVHVDEETGAENLWILLYDPDGNTRETIVLTNEGTALPGTGKHRIGKAPNAGKITATADGFVGYYSLNPPENLHYSDSGAFTITSREDDLLKGTFHFAAVSGDRSSFVSLLGAFNAEPVENVDGRADLP